MIDKIYHPYVQPLEQELEIRLLQQNNQSGIADNTRMYRLAYGRSLSDRLFIEAYLVGQGSSSESLDLQSIEMEIKWQLTEQGEYWADWGVLAELSKGIGNNIYEASIGLIAEKEFGHWSGTTNFIIEQEWGSGID
ncbi:MAG: hypothetical protein HN620_07090, partial [Porticoccaceae bacterium]|nr:hypothetical protein [Porticoccaceae bacterium]